MQEFRYQLKHMGILFYIPIIVVALFIPFIILTPINAQNMVFISLEFILIPLSAWWTIYQVYYFYHQGAEEILLHFFSKNLIFNYIKFLSIFIGLVVMLVGLFSIKFNLNFLHILLLLVGQSVLFSSIGLLIAVIFKDVQSAIVLLALYTSTEIITFGQLLPGVHLFVFEIPNSLSSISITCVIYCSVSMIIICIIYRLGKTLERNIIYHIMEQWAFIL